MNMRSWRQAIIGAVMETTGRAPSASLFTPNHDSEDAELKRLIAYALVRRSGMPIEEIAAVLGYRCHSPVAAAVRVCGDVDAITRFGPWDGWARCEAAAHIGSALVLHLGAKIKQGLTDPGIEEAA